MVDQAPEAPEWLHELKFDGYRMHARLERGTVRLLTRTGLDWTRKYPAIAAAVGSVPAGQAYLDGELCGVRPDGTTSFSLIQNASDSGNSDALVFSCSTCSTSMAKPFTRCRFGIGRSVFATCFRARVRRCISAITRLAVGGPSTTAPAPKVEGIVSKRVDAPYAPGNRGLWLKVKCLNREEFVVVGWTDPKGDGPGSGRCCLLITPRIIA